LVRKQRDIHPDRHAERDSASMARRYPVRAVPDVLRAKTQRREDVGPAANGFFIATVRPTAASTGKRACRPKPSSLRLCVFARNKKSAALKDR